MKLTKLTSTLLGCFGIATLVTGCASVLSGPGPTNRRGQPRLRAQRLQCGRLCRRSDDRLDVDAPARQVGREAHRPERGFLQESRHPDDLSQTGRPTGPSAFPGTGQELKRIFNPKGIMSSSPGLRACELPWVCAGVGRKP